MSDRRHELYVAKIQEEMGKYIADRADESERELRTKCQDHELSKEEQASITRRIQEIGEKADKSHANHMSHMRQTKKIELV